ncbi:MAG TPA: thioesterase family protein [Acidimicrobiales bacterium]|nr:thioesterase family protein [Acidimicrobiales bacterium]
MPAALFVTDRDRVMPTDRSRGPWSPDALHGGPVAAVMARAIERCESPVPMEVTRLTVELLKPVPLAPLLITARVVRQGKRVQLVEARAVAGEQEVARTTGLRIRTADIPVPDQPPLPPTPTDPMAATPRPPVVTYVDGGAAYHLDGVEMRFAAGSFQGDGPSTVWMRLCQPIVAGEEPSPLQRVAAVADFGNGISKVVPFDRYAFINPDLTIAIFRPPRGEWVGLDALSRLASNGIGQAESLLFDEDGPLGRALQSLYVDRRKQP